MVVKLLDRVRSAGDKKLVGAPLPPTSLGHSSKPPLPSLQLTRSGSVPYPAVGTGSPMAPPLIHSVSPKLPPTPTTMAGGASEGAEVSQSAQTASSDDRFSTSSLDAYGAKGGDGKGAGADKQRECADENEDLDMDSMLNELDKELGEGFFLPTSRISCTA